MTDPKSDRNAAILGDRLRHGRTQAELAKAWGISRVRVCQILKRELKRQVLSKLDPDWAELVEAADAMLKPPSEIESRSSRWARLERAVTQSRQRAAAMTET